MRGAANDRIAPPALCISPAHARWQSALRHSSFSRLSPLTSCPGTKVASVPFAFFWRLCHRITTPFYVVLLSTMWCCVILIISFAFASHSNPVYSQTNGQRHINKVQSFNIVTKIEKSEKNDNDSEPSPLILHRKSPAQPLIQKWKLAHSKPQYLHEKLVQSFGEEYASSPAYRRVVSQCSEDKRRPGKVLNFNQAPYVWPQRELCQGQMDLLVAVHTRPTNFASRQLIRETYGSMQNVYGKRIVVAFFVGNSGNRDTQRQIDEEAKENRDVIVRDFREHYRNMTIKHLAVMEWIMDFCTNVKYLVKVDDDVFVNIFQVITFTDTFRPSGFYCSRNTGAKTMRSGKWKLTHKEYPKKTFPPYCMGYGYVMRAAHAKSLYWCSVFSNFLWIDDVLVGGILPKKLWINMERFLSGHSVAPMLPSHASEKISDFMFLLGPKNTVIPSIFRRLWRAALQFCY